MMNLLLQSSRLAGQSYEQLFTDERALTRYHQRETVWLLAFVAVSVALFASGAGAFAVQDLSHRLQRGEAILGGETWDFGLWALAGWSVAILLGVAAFVIRDRTPEVLRILRDRPGEVSWAYVVVLVGYPATGVFVGTRHGEREAITLRGRLGCDLFLERVAALCPQAAIGHSVALEEQFDRDPSLGRFPRPATS